MKKILVISDPEFEMGFSDVCQYCQVVQERLGNEVFVLPIWPHGRAELIDDVNDIELHIKNISDIIKELKIELEEEKNEGL